MRCVGEDCEIDRITCEPGRMLRLLGACAAAAALAAAYALHRRRRSGTIGLSAERLQRITERVEWEVAQRRAPFMQFVLARGGKVVHTAQAGYADLGMP